MTRLAEWFWEDVAAGTSVTLGNTTPTLQNVIAPTTSTVQYSAAQAVEGVQSVRFQTTDTEVPTIVWQSAVGLVPKLFTRTYFYLPALPASTLYFHHVRSNNTSRADVSVNTSGTLTLRQGISAVVYTSTATVATGAWNRIEWMVDNGTSTQQLRFYKGANLHTTTPTEDSGAKSFTQGTFDRVRWGFITSQPNLTMYVDANAIDDADWIGPYSTASDHAVPRIDTVSIIDLATVEKAAAQTRTDPMGLSDTPVRRGVAGVGVDETELTDSILIDKFVQTGYALTFDEEIGVEEYDEALTLTQQVDDSAGLVDIHSRSAALGQALVFTDDLGVGDLPSREYGPGFTDTTTIIDFLATSAAGDVTLTFVDPVSLGDTISFRRDWTFTFNENVTLDDAATPSGSTVGQLHISKMVGGVLVSASIDRLVGGVLVPATLDKGP